MDFPFNRKSIDKCIARKSLTNPNGSTLNELKSVAEKLKLSTSGSKRDICLRIIEYYEKKMEKLSPKDREMEFKKKFQEKYGNKKLTWRSKKSWEENYNEAQKYNLKKFHIPSRKKKLWATNVGSDPDFTGKAVWYNPKTKDEGLLFWSTSVGEGYLLLRYIDSKGKEVEKTYPARKREYIYDKTIDMLRGLGYYQVLSEDPFTGESVFIS